MPKASIPFPTNKSHFLAAEGKVVLFVLTTLLAAELTMRGIEAKISKDVSHLENIPSITRRLNDVSRSPNQLKILFVGNSLVREGIESQSFASILFERTNRDVDIQCIHPDNSALAEWYYLIDRYVLNERIPVEHIFIGFQGSHLQDAPTRHINFLGRYYCGWRQLPSLYRFDFRDSESWLQYVVNASSSAISNRERVERRVLNQLIPHYQEGIQSLNKSTLTKATKSSSIPKYERLRELAAKLKSREIKLTLVEFPIQDPNPLEPELKRTVETLGISLIEYTSLEPLPTNSYADELHLNDAGASAFTTNLANAIPLVGKIDGSK